MDSFFPICEVPARYVVAMPMSCAATSNEQRVRVLVFSKIRAALRPMSGCHISPFFFILLSFAEKSRRYAISSCVKSCSVKKSLPLRSTIPPSSF